MMLRIALFVVLAIGAVGAAALGWVLLAIPATTVTTVVGPPAKVLVLVAVHPLRGGSLLKPEDLTVQEIASADMPAGANLDTPQSHGALFGGMIRRSLGAGQPILAADVVRPGDHGFLAAVLDPNMRAVTVAVDAVSGTAGLIWPGDRVDLILTQALDDPTLAVGRRVAAETVLLDARVIAIDQQIVQGQAPDGSVAPANRTATLEVTPGQAERVLVAGRLGKLTLSVRSADRRDSITSAGPEKALAAPLATQATGIEAAGPVTSSVTWAGDVSPALGVGETRSAPNIVRVFQGGADGKEFRF